MTVQAIRSALEVALISFDTMQTAWENDGFQPTDGVPYQDVTILWNDPENPTMGDDYYRQRGIMSIRQMYPVGIGSGDPAIRAEALRAFFHRASSKASGTTTVIVDKTPTIGTGAIEESRYVLPVRVFFYSDVFAGDDIDTPIVGGDCDLSQIEVVDGGML